MSFPSYRGGLHYAASGLTVFSYAMGESIPQVLWRRLPL